MNVVIENCAYDVRVTAILSIWSRISELNININMTDRQSFKACIAGEF